MMKKNLLLILPVTLLAIACGNQQKSSSNDEAAFDPNNAKCYQAVSDSDSASLKMSEAGEKVQGTLKFDFKDKQDTEGTVQGEFKGDTLFVDYTFELNGVTYKNPQVFLKKGDELLQGSGELETYVGRTFFKKGAPIDFSSGFDFKPVNCK